MSKPRYALATDGLVYDVPRRRGLKTQRIAEVARQPTLNSAYNPSEKGFKTADGFRKNFAANKFADVIMKKGRPAL